MSAFVLASFGRSPPSDQVPPDRRTTTKHANIVCLRDMCREAGCVFHDIDSLRHTDAVRWNLCLDIVQSASGGIWFQDYEEFVRFALGATEGELRDALESVKKVRDGITPESFREMSEPIHAGPITLIKNDYCNTSYCVHTDVDSPFYVAPGTRL